MFIYIVFTFLVTGWYSHVNCDLTTEYTSIFVNPDTRIIGGYEIFNTTSDKHFASLKIQFAGGVATRLCAGTIISPKHILTACHCVIGMTSVEVRIGSSQCDQGGLIYTGNLATCHHKYSILSTDNDIAIITLTSDMQLDGIHTDKANLPDTECKAPTVGDIIHVCGCGLTVPPPATTGRTNQASCAEIPVIDHATCVQQYKAINLEVTKNMFCAGYPEGGVDSCSGDSGSGAMLYVLPPPPGGAKQIGIVSWGKNCAEKGFAGVYTVVCNYVCWIKITMKIPLSLLEIVFCASDLAALAPKLPSSPSLPGLPTGGL